ncbi:MAG: CU044_2847 family protein [Methanothrix sp.]
MPDSTEEKEKEMPILIEFPSEGGIETVALFKKNPDEVRARSERALAQAMNQIIDMASRIEALQKEMPKDFSQVEVEFGINFNWEVGALLAKAGAEANINVTLTWTKPESSGA